MDKYFTDTVIPFTLKNGKIDMRFFQTQYLDPSREYFVAVKECCIPYVWYNVSDTFNNNKLRIIRNLKFAQEIKIDNGNHDCDSLNHQMIKFFQKPEDEIPVYFSTPPGIPNRIAISLHDLYEIDFRGYEIRKLLGFDEKVYSAKDNISDFIANIENDLLSIHIHCNLVRNAFYCDFETKRFLTGDVIYSFIPDGKINDWLIEKPNPLEKHLIVDNQIEEIKLYITDQNNKPIDFQGEDCIVKLEISSKPIV